MCYTCDTDHTYKRKTIARILSCPDTDHSVSGEIAPLLSMKEDGDVVFSIDFSFYAGIGIGGSIGINLTELFGG